MISQGWGKHLFHMESAYRGCSWQRNGGGNGSPKTQRLATQDQQTTGPLGISAAVFFNGLDTRLRYRISNALHGAFKLF
jgi:hypothetical protein